MNRKVIEQYNQLSFTLIQFEVPYNGLDIIEGESIHCHISFDRMNANIMSQSLTLPSEIVPVSMNISNHNAATYRNEQANHTQQVNQTAIIGFNQKIKILSNELSSEKSIFIKLSYSNGSVIG